VRRVTDRARRRFPARDAGAAAVEFVLVGVLVTMLFLGLVQLGVDLHIRNTLAACAAEGARYGANADVASSAAAAAKANELIAATLSPRFADARPGPATAVDGAPVVSVVVDVRLPLIAGWLFAVGPALHVEGHALLEPP